MNFSGVRASRHLASRLTYITSIFEGTGPSSSDDQIRAIAYKHPAFEVLPVDQLPPADHHDHAVQPRSKPGPERGAGRPVLKPLIDHRAICGRRVSSRRRQRCIKIRPSRLSAGLHQGTTMQPATSGTRDNRAPTRLNRAAMRYPAPPSASYGAGTPFHRSPYLPRCTDARSAPQATPPANFSILASAVRRC